MVVIPASRHLCEPRLRKIREPPVGHFVRFLIRSCPVFFKAFPSRNISLAFIRLKERSLLQSVTSSNFSVLMLHIAFSFDQTESPFPQTWSSLPQTWWLGTRSVTMPASTSAEPTSPKLESLSLLLPSCALLVRVMLHHLQAEFYVEMFLRADWVRIVPISIFTVLTA